MQVRLMLLQVLSETLGVQSVLARHLRRGKSALLQPGYGSGVFGRGGRIVSPDGRQVHRFILDIGDAHAPAYLVLVPVLQVFVKAF